MLKILYILLLIAFGNAYSEEVDGVHYGTDFAIPIGTPIPTPVDGRVTHNDYSEFTGNRIAVTDKNGIEHHFFYMNKPSHLKIGTVVKKGDIIGYSGASGRAKSPHFH